MAKTDWIAPGGWTCQHQRAKSLGPCEKCNPGTGLCPACKRPLDDHTGLGTMDFSCRRIKA